ncbi:MAG: hypothetical protein FWE42_01150 [Defluviitaleaceae bacterium]|nr:hypothetical protein [Defluviitaleaceae bacterium]
MKKLRKPLALAIALCLVAFFFASTVYAFGYESCCVAECACIVECSCVGDCYCNQECDCSALSCLVCEAIVKRREMPQQQSLIVVQCRVDVCLFSAKIMARHEIMQIYATCIVEDNVRMNI